MLLQERNPDEIELRVSLSQLKRLYVALFRQLRRSGPEGFDELDENDMLLTLQMYLQRRARQAGVDGTIHADWEAFLGMNQGASCERPARGRSIEGSD